MAYIKVNHRQLENTAAEIDAYVDVLKRKMNNAQSDVTALSSFWEGSDYIQFKSEFNKLDDKYSAHSQMIKALESYSNYLKAAAKKYKDAQSNAVNRANDLPRW